MSVWSPAGTRSLPGALREATRQIGSTAMAAISYRVGATIGVVHAKLEYSNLSGSIKDRLALYILAAAYRRGDLVPGQPIVEATSGNTGIALATLGQKLGHPTSIFMPDWMSRERLVMLRGLGAEVQLVSAAEGGFRGSIERARLTARTAGAFAPCQFDNPDNVTAHASTTGPELWWQMGLDGCRPAAFVAGVGTGGTIMGVGRYLRSRSPTVRLHPVEPASSPTLSTGHKVGAHRIQGISDEFVPSLLDLSVLDEVIAVDDGDAIRMAQLLGRQLGLAVGISSGANLLAAIRVQLYMGVGQPVATVFPDDRGKYLSTDLMRDEPIRDDHLTSQTELLGARTIPGCELPDAYS